MNFKNIALLAGLGFAALSLTPAVASAAFDGWTNRPVAQTAGPGRQYPQVGFVPAGVKVRIYGCLRGVTQCDISWRGNRGWVPGNALNGFYRNKRVPLLSFGPQLGLPFITFNFGYWDNHYRGKPFFNQRGNWDKNWKKGVGDGPSHFDMPKKKFDDKKPGMGGNGPGMGDNGSHRNRDCKPGSTNPDCKLPSMQ